MIISISHDGFTLYIMEPNMSIHKTCLLPLTIAEGVNKKYSKYIKNIICFCPPKTKNFKKLVESLTIFKENKIQFYDRMIMPSVLSGMKKWNTKIVLISHHIMNNLNYLPMEF